MSTSLFRPQATNALSLGQFGEPIVYQPMSLRVQCAALLALFSLLFLFAFLVPFKSFESVSGELILADGSADVFSPRRGVLVQLAVWEGKAVKKGEILARVSSDNFDEKGRNELTQGIRLIDQQISVLTQKRDLLSKQFELELTQQRFNLATATSELNKLKFQQELVQNRVALSGKAHRREASLWEQEMLSAASYDQSSDAYLAVQLQAANNELSVLSKESAVSDAQLRIEMAPARLSEQLLDIDYAILQLQSRRAESEALLAFSIVSPRDGVVGNIVPSVGDRLESNSPMLRVLAADNTFQAQLLVPSRGLAKLKIGQVVLLGFDALPQELYGRYRGVVQSISASPFAIFDGTAVRQREPMFVLKVSIDKRQLLGQKFVQLREGMQLNAEIITDEMSLLSRILLPLKKVRQRI